MEAPPSGWGGGAPCVSGTKLRILDPAKGDCFAARMQMAVTGAELAAAAQSLISCNKTDSVSLTLHFCMWGNRDVSQGWQREPGLDPLPLVLGFLRWLRLIEVSMSWKEGKTVPRGSGGQVTALTGLSPRAAFDRPAGRRQAGSLRFPLSL